MKLTEILKDEKKRDRILGNGTLFLVFELLLYIVYFEVSLSIKFKMITFILAGILAIISIVFLALGIGNKNKRNILHAIEFFIEAICVIMAYPILTTIPAIIKIGRYSIWQVIPFGVIFAYYLVKEIKIIKNYIKN